MDTRWIGRKGVFAALFFLGALMLGAALAMPAWRWAVALTQAGFLHASLLYLTTGLFILVWLVPVLLVLEEARPPRQPV